MLYIPFHLSSTNADENTTPRIYTHTYMRISECFLISNTHVHTHTHTHISKTIKWVEETQRDCNHTVGKMGTGILTGVISVKRRLVGQYAKQAVYAVIATHRNLLIDSVCIHIYTTHIICQFCTL